jgi:3-phosphoshikimate 1-carboxyvinyltransferase
LEIKPSNIKGRIRANPSKSHEQRIILASILADGLSIILNPGKSDDVETARKIAKDFGANIEITDKKVSITANLQQNSVLNCAESGLCARLFTPLACLVNDKFSIIGEKSLLNRPVTAGFEILEQMGCEYDSNDGKLPVVFSKTQILPDIYEITNNITSQLNSGLFMCMPLLSGNSKFIIKNPVSLPYLLLSLDVMRNFGIKLNYKITDESLIVEILGNQKYKSCEISVEGDWSSAAFPLCAAAINGEIEIEGLNPNSFHADKAILNVFTQAGIAYKYEAGCLNVKKTQIRGFEFNAKQCPDLIPALIILAVFANGKSLIRGAERLLHKESSRAFVMQKELRKAGVKINVDGDLISIEGGQKANASVFEVHGDHRIAMALSVLALNLNGTSIINGSETVKKSYPEFFMEISGLIKY